MVGVVVGGAGVEVVVGVGCGVFGGVVCLFLSSFGGLF